MTRETTLANKDVRPRGFVHIVFRTGRFEEMKEFYQCFLNCWEVMGTDKLTFQTYDHEHHRIAILNVGDVPALDRRAAGVEHFAYAYESLGDILANYLRLKKWNILPYWCINHGPTTSFYYRDPDGNQIEAQTDNFGTVEELTAFFGTEAFKANPIGVEFDPERLVQMYLDGVPEQELKRQGIAPIAPGTGYTLEF